MGVTRRVLAVDGTNLLVRAMKATEGRATMSVNGVNTGPVLLFINMLSKYVKQERPDRLVVCWDGGRSLFRLAIFPNYKHGRTPVEMEDEHSESVFHLTREFLSCANVHHVTATGFEADDLIAHYWRAKENDHRFIILSGDKDFLQLLDGWTEQVRPGGADERWTTNRVRTELKCKPENLADAMALTGDKIDGVPGIPGFGHKTACKALAAHDWNLGRLVTTTDPKWAKKIFDQRDSIMRNRHLVDLRYPPPIGYEIHLGSVVPEFHPTTPESALWGVLLEWLDFYRMASVRSRLEANALWSESQIDHRAAALRLFS